MDEPIYLEYLGDEIKPEKEEKKEKKITSFAMIPYYSLKDGNIEGVLSCKALIDSVDGERMSSDELMNKKFLFVSSTTMAAFFAMQGGMSVDAATELKNLYIGRMDDCKSIEAVDELHTIMFLDFTRKVQESKEAEEEQSEKDSEGRAKISRSIMQAMEYIRKNLHTKLLLKDVGEAVGLSPNYLATRFHAETGSTVQDYARDQRIAIAEEMLKKSNYSLSEIASGLGFGSNSHFIKVFREQKGVTPKQYRLRYYK
ncbi:MAG: helix-turn-helix transcriptional regulator [Eubacterium sp.]|nr:helix-turn-helix transcriptional regulator [Eubacterium sp.]